MADTLHASGTSPNVTVSDLQRSLKFYTDGLGFEIEHPGEVNGVIRYYVLKAGDARFGIGQDDFAKGRERVKGVGVRFWLYTTQDITKLAERATKAGITLHEGPAPLPWGPMAFAVVDPDGYQLTIANK